MSEGLNSAATLSLEINTQGAEDRLLGLENRYAALLASFSKEATANGVVNVNTQVQVLSRQLAVANADIEGLKAQIEALGAGGTAAVRGLTTSLSAASSAISNSLKLPAEALANLNARMKQAGEEASAALQKGLTNSNYTVTRSLLEGYEKGTIASLERVEAKLVEARSYLQAFGAESANIKFGKLALDDGYLTAVRAKLAEVTEIEAQYNALGTSAAEISASKVALAEFRKVEATKASALERAALEAQYEALGTSAAEISASRFALAELRKIEATKASVLERAALEAQYNALGAASDSLKAGRSAKAEWAALQAKELKAIRAAELADQVAFGDAFNALLSKQAKEGAAWKYAQLEWEQAQSVRSKEIQQARDIEKHNLQVAAQEKALALERQYILASEAQRVKAALNASKLMAAGYKGDLSAEFAPSVLGMASAGGVSALEKQYAALVPAVSAAADAQKKWNATGSEAHAMARGLSGTLGQLWMTYGQIAPLLAGAALGAGFKSAMQRGAEFEYQLTFVKALGQESAAAVEDLSKAAITLGSTGMKGPVELASGLRVLAQAGLSARDAILAIPSAANLAVVGEMSLEAASITLVGVMHAFKLSVTDVARVGDVFAKAAAVSQTSVASMTEAMKTASVVGEQYGVSMEDAATAITLLARVNIQGTAAGTSLRNMLKELYTPGKQAADTLKMLGVSATDTSGKLLPMADVIYKLKDSLAQYDEGSQVNILQRLFGERGAKEAVQMLALTREAWDDLQKKITESSGFMGQVAAELETSTKGVFQQAKNTLEADLIGAFNATDGAAKSLALSLRELFSSEKFKQDLNLLVDSLSSVSMAVLKLAPLLVYAAEAWALWKVVGVAAFAMGKVTLAIAAVSAAATAAWASVVALAAGVGGIVSAAAAAAGALELLTAAAAMLLAPGVVLVAMIASLGAAYKAWQDLTPQSVKAAESFTMAMDRQNDAMREGNKALEERIRLAGGLPEVDGTMKDKNLSAARTEYSDQLKILNNPETPFYYKALAARGVLEAQANLVAAEDRFAALQRTSREKDVLSVKAYSEEKLQVLRDFEYRAAKLKKDVPTASVKEAIAQIVPGMSQVERRKREIAIDDDIQALNLRLNGTGSKRLSDGKEGKAAAQAEIAEYEGLRKLRDSDLAYQSRWVDLQLKGHEISAMRAADLQAEIALLRAKNNAEAADKELAEVKKSPKSASAVQEAINKRNSAYQEVELVEATNSVNTRLAHKELMDGLDKQEAELLGKRKSYLEQYEAESAASSALVLRDIQDSQRKQQSAYNDAAAAGNTEAMASAEAKLKALDADRERVLAVRELAVETAKGKDVALAASTALDALEARVTSNNNRWGGGFLSNLTNAADNGALVRPQMQAAQERVSELEGMGSPSALKDAEKLKKHIEKLNKEIAKSYSDAWKQANADVTASLTKLFGTLGTTLGSMLGIYKNYGEDRKKINEEADNAERDSGGDPEKMLAAEKKANRDRLQASVELYANMAGAASGLFSKQTTAYKVLQGLEKEMHVVKLAMMAAEMYAELTAIATTTSASVAAEPVKAAAKTPTVIMEFMSWMGPWGAAAAAAAIAAVLGGAVGGGKSGAISSDAASAQKANEGTGTVLGDSTAQSESIANSLESLESMARPELSFTSQMVGLLRNIDNSLSGTTNMLLSTGFDAIGASFQGVSSSKNNVNIPLIGGLFGSSSSSSSLSDVGLIFAKQTMAQAAEAISLQQYQTTKTEWSKSGFLGMGEKSGTNYSTNISEVDGKVSEAMSKAVAQMVTAVTTLGEKLGATPAELASVYEADTGLGKVSLMGKTGEEIQSMLSAVFSAMGDRLSTLVAPDIGDFQLAGEGYLQTLVRVSSGMEEASFYANQFGLETVKVSDLLNKQGDVGAELLRQSIGLAESTFSTVTETLDGFVGGGSFTLTHAVATLSGVGEIIKSFSGSASDLADLYKGLLSVRAMMVDTGAGADGLTSRLLNVAGGLSTLSSSLGDYYEGFYSAEERRANSVKAVVGTLAKAGVNVTESQVSGMSRKAFRDMVEGLGTITDATAPAYAALLSVSGAILDIAEAGEAAAAAAATAASEAVTNAHNNLRSAYEREAGALQTVADKFKDFGKSLRNFRDSLLTGNLSTLSPEQKYVEEKQRFKDVSTRAALGDESAIGQLQDAATSFLSASSEYNASSAAYAADFLAVQDALTRTADVADRQSNLAEQQLAELRNLVSPLIDINQSVLSVKDAIEASWAAIIGNGGRGAASTAATYTSAGGATYTTANDTWTGVNNSGSATTAQLKAIIEEKVAGGISGQRELYDAAKAVGLSLADLNKIAGAPSGTAEEWARANGLPAYATGTNFIAETGPVLVHRGEEIKPAAYVDREQRERNETNALLREVVTEVRALISQGGAVATASLGKLEAVANKLDATKRQLARAA